MGHEVDSRFHSIHILREFDRTNSRLSDLFKYYFESQDISPKYRPSITFLVQETTRWKGYLDFLLSKQYHGNFKKSEPLLKNILRLGAYEILFRDRVPRYASINEAVELTKKLVNARASRLTNAVLHRIQQTDRPNLNTLAPDSPVEEIAIVSSHPEWMIQRWLNSLGFRNTLRLCQWNNTIPRYTIRRNPTKVGKAEFESFLDMECDKWERSLFINEFYTLDRIIGLQKSHEFEKGYFSFQDVSAGLVTQLIDAQDGTQILDVCAAPGGKTTYLAERFGNKVTILAYDKDKKRMQQLEENAQRLGLKSIQISIKDGTTDEYPPSDVILVDAPCTGTGVMAKRADLRWRRCESDLKEMQRLQLSLLSHISSFVKLGGVLIYATCSLDHEENWGVVNQFLQSFPHFHITRPGERIPKELVDGHGTLRTFPPDHGIDGIFAVILKRES